MTRSHAIQCRQIIRCGGVAVFAPLFLLGTPIVLAQTESTRATDIPQTSWGKPDLQGVWTNATLTPLERASTMDGL